MSSSLGGFIAWEPSKLRVDPALPNRGADFLLFPLPAPVSAPRVTKAIRKPTAVQRPATEKVLAAALRAQSEGVFIAERRPGPKGLKIVFVNESFCTMTRYAPADLVGQWQGILHGDKTELVRLRRANRTLEMENEILKRAAFFARENVLPK